jgi:sulfoxide reductase heme-binding subunit YedZ
VQDTSDMCRGREVVRTVTVLREETHQALTTVARAASSPALDHPVGRKRGRSPLVWVFRAFLILPFVFMGPEIALAIVGHPSGLTDLRISDADVMGNGALLAFMMMMTVTPIHTMTGWKWHECLRRDYGLGMAAAAFTDLTLAIINSGKEFQGGLLTRIAGHTFLLAGTVSVTLLIPLALTANRRAQRWLGPHWKTLHRLVYVIWATILIHLAFLFAFRTLFIAALEMSIPLFVLRIPALRKWWVSARKQHRRLVLRWIVAIAIWALYGVGYFTIMHEYINVGVGAILLHPPS